MSNTLTGLIPDLYASMDVVSQEPTGFIQSVSLDASAERAAVGEPVKSFVAPAGVAEDIVPSATPPNTGDNTFGYTPITITKSRAVPFRWTGEEQRGVNNGPGYANMRRQQMIQALRTLRNEMEADIASLHVGASRAYGTAGTTPFASDLSDPAQIRKLLIDNGAPASDLHLIINTSAGAKMRTLAQLTKANEAGTDAGLRRGVLLDLDGFAIRESAAVRNFTKGGGTGYLVNNSGGYVAGNTSITVDTGSGTLLPGDVVTFAGDTNKYVVASATSGSTVTNITIAAPGLLGVIADNAAVSVGGSYAANMAFSRNALVLLARQPAMPIEGDNAEDVMSIEDPITGITYEVAMYKEVRRVRYQIGLSWGVANMKPEHSVILLG
jgi:hypothetical protein